MSFLNKIVTNPNLTHNMIIVELFWFLSLSTFMYYEHAHCNQLQWTYLVGCRHGLFCSLFDHVIKKLTKT